MKILHIILKHVVWRFRICNCFLEIFKFRDFKNTLRNFAKYVFSHIFAKVTIYSKIAKIAHKLLINSLRFDDFS